MWPDALSLFFLDLPDPNTIVLLVGCFLLIVGVLGGGLEVKEIKIPSVDKTPRFIAGVLGLAMVAISLGFPGFVESLKNSNSASTDASKVPFTTYGKAANLPSDAPSLMTRELTADDLAGKDKMQLDEMRNEIFARHGRMFKDPEIQKFFAAQPWYHPLYQPDQFPASILTPVQQKNVAILFDHEYH